MFCVIRQIKFPPIPPNFVSTKFFSQQNLFLKGSIYKTKSRGISLFLIARCRIMKLLFGIQFYIKRLDMTRH